MTLLIPNDPLVSADGAALPPTAGSPAARRTGRTTAIVLDPPDAPLTGLGHVVVCLPTYNEIDNVEPMLRALDGALDGHGEVLVIDDGSPDGTADAAARLGRELGCVDVLRRTAKDGLGRAYLAGFKRALDHGADLIIQMDCDFSHDPRDVRRLAAASRDCDLALGSRYVAGGAVVNWPRPRIALSRGGSLYARSILGVGVRDLTGGFKCWRRDVLQSLGLDDVRTSGYGFQIELTFRALCAGFRVAEVPITFTERVAGKSKMSGAIALEALRQVPALRRAVGGAAR
jgi:dolichol-phosphate mannosyltransferase